MKNPNSDAFYILGRGVGGLYSIAEQMMEQFDGCDNSVLVVFWRQILESSKVDIEDAVNMLQEIVNACESRNSDAKKRVN